MKIKSYNKGGIKVIRMVEIKDAKAISEIYNYYIKKTTITFETKELSEKEMQARIEKILKSAYPFIVYEENNKILGYAYAGKWRERISYKKTLETSVYVDRNEKSKGIGKKLYSALIKECKKNGVHVLIGVLSYPNTESQRLHKNAGFEKTGHFREVANKFGKFIDVEFWSLMLNKAI